MMEYTERVQNEKCKKRKTPGRENKEMEDDGEKKSKLMGNFKFGQKDEI